MSIFKKVIIIVLLVVFIASCVIGTYYAIQYSNQQSYELNSEVLNPEVLNPEVSNSGLFKVDLFEQKEDNSYLAIKYDNMHMKNNITTKENVIDIKDGKQYTYYSIEGLKNKKIQNKINNEIKANVLDIVGNLKNYNIEYDSRLCMEIGFNNSNVISIILNNYYLAGKSIILTYDLTTGNQIKFSDLFINNCQQKLWDVMTSSIKSFYNEYEYSEETGEYDPNPMTEEDFLYKIKKYYNENFDNLDFYINDSFSIVIDLIYAEDDIEDILNGLYLEIYDYYYLFTGFTKYLTEKSIFENGNLDKNNYTLLYDCDVTEYKDNLFISIEDHIYTDNEIINNYYNKYIKDIIADYKKKADENSEVVTYLQFKLYIKDMYYLQDYSNPYFVSIDMLVYTMPKDEYKNNFRKSIFENHYNYTNEFEYNKDKVECVHVMDCYPIYLDNEETLIKLSTSDFFVEGYDYLTVAKEKLLIALEEGKQFINGEMEANNIRNAINSLTELPIEPIKMYGYYFYFNLYDYSVEMYSLNTDFCLSCKDVFDLNMIK